MAFALRRPFNLSSSLSASSRQLFKYVAAPAVQAPGRQPLAKVPAYGFSTFKSNTPKSSLIKSKDALQQAFRRSYMQETYQVPRPDTGNLRQRLLYGAAIFGGTVVALNLIFNRETREDGGMPIYERSYLNETFMHTGLGVGMIAVAARALHQNGWSFRIMTANPWMVIGLGLVGSIGTMYATFATPPTK